MHPELVISVLFLLLVSINLFQLKFSTPGSDHYFHFGYINSIRANKHRFITKVITFINEDDFPDPQLYHWLLSLIPGNFLERNYRYFGLLFNVISLTFFIVFLHLLYPYLIFKMDYSAYLLVSGLVYIITPFEYFSWNAKNVGLSARGFGLMLGHLFVFSITLYVYSSDKMFFAASVIVSYIILLSSQFAYQFVFFFCIIFSIVTGNLLLAAIPFISAGIFLITFPNWSRVFFIRQWRYKKMYYSVFSRKFGLKARYSIWRDFLYDFWIVLKQKGIIKGFEYIYRNPVIELAAGFPALILGMFGLWMYPDPGLMERNMLFFWIIFSTLLIFLLTSFRPTRFLGEPQRYVEFVFPLIALLPAMVPGSFFSISVLIVSFGVLLFELVVIRLMAKRKGGGTTTAEKTMMLLECFKSIPKDKNENKVVSNNYDVLKYFAEKDYRILNVNVTSAYTGGIHFNELFPENFGKFSLFALVKLIKHYNIPWIILDGKMTSKDVFEREIGIPISEIKTIHHYTIYKVC